MTNIKIIGLSAPAGFQINEHLKNNPANKAVVAKMKREVLAYITGCYPKGTAPIFAEWYAGITDSTHNRYNAHKRTRNLDDLPHYKKFYLYTVSNARALEAELFKKFRMGNTSAQGGIHVTSKYLYVFHKKKAMLNGLIE